MIDSITYFKSKIDSLEHDLSIAVSEVRFFAAFKEIQNKYHLHIDQASLMELVVLQYMFGEITDIELKNHLIQDAKISVEISENILEDLNKMVFLPILENYKKIQTEQEEEVDHDEDTNQESSKNDKNTEDHTNLSAEDILAAIENPQPSVPVVHETIIPVPTVQTTPIVQGKPSTADILAAATPISSQPTPTNIPAQQTASPVQQVSQALNTNLTTPTVRKPEQIKTNLDPYRESI